MDNYLLLLLLPIASIIAFMQGLEIGLTVASLGIAVTLFIKAEESNSLPIFLGGILFALLFFSFLYDIYRRLAKNKRICKQLTKYLVEGEQIRDYGLISDPENLENNVISWYHKVETYIKTELGTTKAEAFLQSNGLLPRFSEINDDENRLVLNVLGFRLQRLGELIKRLEMKE